jgi:hypothetical protein
MTITGRLSATYQVPSNHHSTSRVFIAELQEWMEKAMETQWNWREIPLTFFHGISSA